MFDSTTSSGIPLLILFYLNKSLLNDVVINFLFGLKDWHVSGVFRRFLFRSLRDLLIWLESWCHDFDLWSWRIRSQNPSKISSWSAVGVRQDRLSWIKDHWLCSGLIFWCSYDLFEAISTLSQNWLIVGESIRRDLEVALIVSVFSLHSISIIGARFESSNRLICRSLGPLMNLIRKLEVSVLKHFMHLIGIFILFVSAAKLVSSRKLNLLLR